jgi:WD40 repeat protein
VLAAGLRDGSVRILNQDGIEKRNFLYGNSAVNALAWAPNTLAAVSRSAGAVRVWDDEGNARVSESGQPDRGDAGVALSPDGSLMATLSLDGLTTLWNVASRKPRLILRTPPSEEAELTSALFVDPRRLLVAYKSGKVRLFALDPAGLKNEAAAFLKAQPCNRTP